MDTRSGAMRPTMGTDIAEDEILVSKECAKILESVPPNERIKFLLESHDPRLQEDKKKLLKKHGKVASSALPGRNKPCPCGSGKKFKKCCGSVVSPAEPLKVSEAAAELC